MIWACASTGRRGRRPSPRPRNGAWIDSALSSKPQQWGFFFLRAALGARIDSRGDPRSVREPIWCRHRASSSGIGEIFSGVGDPSSAHRASMAAHRAPSLVIAELSTGAGARMGMRGDRSSAHAKSDGKTPPHRAMGGWKLRRCNVARPEPFADPAPRALRRSAFQTDNYPGPFFAILSGRNCPAPRSRARDERRAAAQIVIGGMPSSASLAIGGGTALIPGSRVDEDLTNPQSASATLNARTRPLS